MKRHLGSQSRPEIAGRMLRIPSAHGAAYEYFRRAIPEPEWLGMKDAWEAAFNFSQPATSGRR